MTALFQIVILSLIGLILLLILFAPVKYEISAKNGEMSYKIRWLIVKFPLTKSKSMPKAVTKKQKPRSFLKLIKNIRRKDLLIKYTLQFINCVFKASKLRKISAKIIIGLPNPADTGLVLGFLGIIKAYLARHNFAGDFEGDFVEERMEYELRIMGRTFLWPVLYTGIKLIVKYRKGLKFNEPNPQPQL